MKIVFAGPTLHGVSPEDFPSITFRPPARCGDILHAVRDGATTIGLIDGVFEHMPSVWHKEILHALAANVTVLGAASMGALRAAECDVFGMIGIGKVYEAYAEGEIEDDAEVAQLHAPAELGHLPLSEPLVNVRATLGLLLDSALLSKDEREALLVSAGQIFFKERTYRKIVEETGLSETRKAEIAVLLKKSAINLKKHDAKLLLAMLEKDTLPAITNKRQVQWTFARTRSFSEMLSSGCNAPHNLEENHVVTPL